MCMCMCMCMCRGMPLLAGGAPGSPGAPGAPGAGAGPGAGPGTGAAAGAGAGEGSKEEGLQLIPIDHGFCLPECPTLACFEWRGWPQAEQA